MRDGGILWVADGKGDDLGDRMKKNYENRYRISLTRRMPVIIRVDGKAFHTFTKNCKKPFDQTFIDAMRWAAFRVAEEMQGFKLAYVQSDEASFLLTDYDKLNTEAWFDYNLQKLVSVSASAMTAHFNALYNSRNGVAIFDSRAFNVPREEVANYFLWRARDWARNSLAMLARAHISHRGLHMLSMKRQHDALHKLGINWATDCTTIEKNGTWILRQSGNLGMVNDVRAEFSEIDKLLGTACKTEECNA